MKQHEMSRLEVRQVACVECGAEQGEPCRGRRGPRKANHLTRIDSALAFRDFRRRIGRAA